MRVVALRRSETPRVSRGRKQTEGVKHEEAKADGRGQARDRVEAQVRPHRVRDREGARLPGDNHHARDQGDVFIALRPR